MNQNHFTKIDHFLHEAFTDHSLPPFLPPTREGLMQWIAATGKSFEHNTIIEDMVCKCIKVMIKINMQMIHTVEWRGKPPTGKVVLASGYRFFE